MDVLFHAFDGLWDVGSYVLPFLFVLGMVVLVHELGHFTVARVLGVKVDTFSIGFGRELFGRTDRRGTRWKIAWVPLGGFVKFAGDGDAASMKPADVDEDVDRTGWFRDKSVSVRTAVVAAGPLANILAAILIYAAMASFVGHRASAPIVEHIVPGSPAALAGLLPGDEVIDVDGDRVDYFEDLAEDVSTNLGEPMRFTYLRDGKQYQVSITPVMARLTRAGHEIDMPYVGIIAGNQPEHMKWIHEPPLSAFAYGAEQVWEITSHTFGTFGQLIRGSKEASEQLGGPVRIAQIAGDLASQGIYPLIYMIAILSVSVGVLNLFPVPLLDGGHLVFYAVEAIKGKPVSSRAQEAAYRVGFGLVMMLVIYTTANDILRLFTS